MRQPLCNRIAGCTAHPKSATGHSRHSRHPGVSSSRQERDIRPLPPFISNGGALPVSLEIRDLPSARIYIYIGRSQWRHIDLAQSGGGKATLFRTETTSGRSRLDG